MKKFFIAFLCLATGALNAVAGTESFAQWMLFTGDYAYTDNAVTKKINFNGNSAVTATALMPNGNRVFALAGKNGLYIYDGKQMQEQKMPVDCFAAMSDIISVACDSKNTIWIGTAAGLVKYENGTFTNIPGESTMMQVITDIVITASDKVYISGMVTGEKTYVGGGVSFFNGTGWVNYNKSNSEIPDNLMSDLMLDNNGHLWGIPGKHDMGVAKFDGKSWKLMNTSNGLLTNSIHAIATNSKGWVWLASPKGILEYTGTDWNMKPFSISFSKKLPSFLAQDGTLEVTSLAVEANGTIWLGTRNTGLVSFSQGGLKILNQQNSPVLTNSVLSISIDKDGYKWIVGGYRNQNYATYAFNDKKNKGRTPYIENYGGVTAYREHKKVTDAKWVVYDSTTSPLEFSTMSTIIEDKKRGVIWTANGSDGLIMLKDGNFTTYNHPKRMESSFHNMYLAPDDKLYMAASMGGVKVFENGQINDFAKNPNMGGVVDMTYDKNNVFWSAGSGGVSKFEKGEWETYKKGDGLPSIIVYSIIKDSKGYLWAGTAKGLVKYDTTWKEVGADVDFPSNDFTCITEDNNGKLWLGTNKGLSIYDGSTFTNIPKVESLNLNKFRVNVIKVDKNNVAWIGTDAYGLLRYDGTTWTQYSKKTTGGVLDKITALTIGADGKIYVASEVTSFGDSEFSMPSQNADEQLKQQIASKIKMANPKEVLTIIQM